MWNSHIATFCPIAAGASLPRGSSSSWNYGVIGDTRGLISCQTNLTEIRSFDAQPRFPGELNLELNTDDKLHFFHSLLLSTPLNQTLCLCHRLRIKCPEARHARIETQRIDNPRRSQPLHVSRGGRHVLNVDTFLDGSSGKFCHVALINPISASTVNRFELAPRLISRAHRYFHVPRCQELRRPCQTSIDPEGLPCDVAEQNPGQVEWFKTSKTKRNNNHRVGTWQMVGSWFLNSGNA